MRAVSAQLHTQVHPEHGKHQNGRWKEATAGGHGRRAERTEEPRRAAAAENGGSPPTPARTRHRQSHDQRTCASMIHTSEEQVAKIGSHLAACSAKSLGVGGGKSHTSKRRKAELHMSVAG